ncbi:hypothetical protein ACK8GG_03855 [Micromonosporaceae bacterium DT55]|uniref:hypothetical protein n=1 Tax=Melissospora conviva TaxID=3388432 RepID=UPI003C2A9D1B
MAVSRDVVRRLYATPPAGFVAARDEAVAAARSAGDAAAAREIAKLRKPTVAAWLVNLLAIRRPELVADLVALSDELRAAQRQLRGPRLRELSAQRRALVGALVAAIAELAAEADPSTAAKPPPAEVEATLQAALSDTTIAEQVRLGRLTKTVTYAGFGEVPRPRLRLVTDADAEPAAEQTGQSAEPERSDGQDGSETGRGAGRGGRGGSGADRGAGTGGRGGSGADRGRRERTQRTSQADRAAAAEQEKRRSALRRELDHARTEQERAERDAAEAVAAEEQAVDALTRIEQELADLERRRVGAEHEVSRHKLARKGAERTVIAARRRVGEVEGALEELTDRG